MITVLIAGWTCLIVCHIGEKNSDPRISPVASKLNVLIELEIYGLSFAYSSNKFDGTWSSLYNQGSKSPSKHYWMIIRYMFGLYMTS